MGRMGTFKPAAKALSTAISRRLVPENRNARADFFFLQRLSLAIQRGKVVAVFQFALNYWI